MSEEVSQDGAADCCRLRRVPKFTLIGGSFGAGNYGMWKSLFAENVIYMASTA